MLIFSSNKTKLIQTDAGKLAFLVLSFDIPSSDIPIGTGSQVNLYGNDFSYGCGVFYITNQSPAVNPFNTYNPLEITSNIDMYNAPPYLYLRYNGNTIIRETYSNFTACYYLVMCTFTDGKKLLFVGNSLTSKLTLINPSSNSFGYCTTGEDGTIDIATFYLSNFSSQFSDTNLQNYLNDLYDESKDPSTDPYDRGGTSGGGGGTGDFDDTSDIIGVPSLPSESGLNTGFFTAFVCSPEQMRNISSYLWNNAIQDILDPQTGFGDKLDALKKIVGNPYDAIMGCSLIPVSPTIGGTKEMKMYGVLETGISLSYASSRWVEVDCGTLNVHEYWGGYLDYSPYSKTTSLYLPFIGVVSIDIDLIMNKALQVVYHVDILSGICIAFIVVDGSVKFQYQGHCSTTIPVTSADYSGSIQAGLGLVGNIANVVTSGVGGAMTGGIAGAVTGAVGSAMSQAPSIASNVMGMKPDIKSGGGVGSSGGILSVKKPYLIIERPRQSLPEHQNTFTGYPCNVTMSVGDCAGYTEFETINLDGLFLTDSEKAELESLLKSGVYL